MEKKWERIAGCLVTVSLCWVLIIWYSELVRTQCSSSQTNPTYTHSNAFYRCEDTDWHLVFPASITTKCVPHQPQPKDNPNLANHKLEWVPTTIERHARTRRVIYCICPYETQLANNAHKHHSQHFWTSFFLALCWLSPITYGVIWRDKQAKEKKEKCVSSLIEI